MGKAAELGLRAYRRWYSGHICEQLAARRAGHRSNGASSMERLQSGLIVDHGKRKILGGRQTCISMV